MIHDANVEVTCDNDNCNDSVFVELNYVYRSYSVNSGYYDSSDSSIEKKLVEHHDWVVVDSNHFCCKECAGN